MVGMPWRRLGGRWQLTVCSRAGKVGFGRGNSTRGPAQTCRALATSIFTRVGATRTPQCCPGFGRLCPISGGLCARESRSLGVVHTDDLVDPADEGGDLDVHPRNVFSTTPESPGDKA